MRKQGHKGEQGTGRARRPLPWSRTREVVGLRALLQARPGWEGSSPRSWPRLPQASAYLKQNKYEQAEELYKEILSAEDLPAPLGEPPLPAPPPPQGLLSIPTTTPPVCSPGAPSTGRAGDADKQVRMAVPRLPGGVGLDGLRGLTCPGASQTLRRSSSFSKLRESIRRGSEKLVSRLRGEGAAGAAG